MNSIQAIKDGAASATRIPAPLVISFVVYLIVALALTVPVAAAMEAWVGHRLAARDLARDFDGLLLLEPMVSAITALPADASSSAEAMAASRAAATTLTAMLGTALVALLVAPLPGIVLGGGVLLTYVEGRFAWRRFLWGAWHWLFSFFMLAVLFGLCATLVVALGVIVLTVVEVAQVRPLTIPAVAMIVLVYAVVAMTFEYARIMAVAEDTRNLFQALRRAIVLIARQPMRTFGVYALMSVFGLALIPLYANVVAPVIPFEWALLAIAAQQLFILVSLWARLARWASQVALFRQVKAG
jgi:hypothetical protein